MFFHSCHDIVVVFLVEAFSSSFLKGHQQKPFTNASELGG